MASASTTSITVLCVICDKGKGIFKCEGCLQTFCSKHSINHRHELNKQLEVIEVTYDLVQQTLIQQTEGIREHSFIKKINQWEEESIKRIYQTAEDARKQFFQHANKHTDDIKQKLQGLSNELRQGREQDDFIETDLTKWTEKLKELEKLLVDSIDISIREDSTPLVQNISIECDDQSNIFERIYGDARLEENGKLVIKDTLGGHTEIRGKSEYITGRHRVCFRIEQFPENGWIFFGIISKCQPMEFNSYSSSSAYGWTTGDQISLGGQIINQRTSNVIQNDIIILSIDCDRQIIELKNERSKHVMELSVDINKCSFPWQLHINISRTPNRLRILTLKDYGR